MPSPLTLPFAGVVPAFAGPPRAGTCAAVLGRATVGAGLVLGPFATVRADGETVTLGDAVEFAPGASVFFGCRLRAGSIAIGADTNIQDNCVADAPQGEVAIGRATTLGHNVTLAACRIGCDSLVGMGVRLAEGTVVDDDVLVAAGAHTLPGQVLESGWLWGGRPAAPLKRLDADRRRMMAATITHYCAYADAFRDAEAAAGAG